MGIALIHVECDRPLVEQAAALAVGIEIARIEIATGGTIDPAAIDRPILLAFASAAALEDPGFVDAIDALRGKPLHIALTDVTEVPLGIMAVFVDARPPGHATAIEDKARHFAELLGRIASGRSMPQMIAADRLYSEATRRRIVRDGRSRFISTMAVIASLLALPFMIYAAVANTAIVESEGPVGDTIGISLVTSLLLILPAASILVNEHSWSVGGRTALYHGQTAGRNAVWSLVRTIALVAIAAFIAAGLWAEFKGKPANQEILAKMPLAAMVVAFMGSLLLAAGLSALLAFGVRARHRLLAWFRRNQVMGVSIDPR